MTTCPACKEVLPGPVRSCRWCRAPLHWQGGAGSVEHPPLGAIVPILRTDLRLDPPPGAARSYKGTASAWSPSPHGQHVTLADGKAFTFYYATRMRDTAVRAVFTAHDKHGTFGLVVRHEPLDAHYTAYRFDVTPGTQRVVWRRVAGDKDTASAVQIEPAAAHPAVAPPGAVNEVVIVAYGASLQAWINRQHVISLHDPTFGIGVPGYELEARGGSAQFSVELVELGMLAA